MNSSESFEKYANEFRAKYGYYPIGKDDPSRPSAERILADLGATYNELKALQRSVKEFCDGQS